MRKFAARWLNTASTRPERFLSAVFFHDTRLTLDGGFAQCGSSLSTRQGVNEALRAAR